MGSEEKELDELRRIAKFFHSIVENIPAMVFVKDVEALRFVLFNRAGEQLLGIPRADLLGKTDYDFFPPDEADFFRTKDVETIERGEVVEIPAERLMTRGGERLLHTKKIVIAGDDGAPQYLLGISHDITARVRAEKDLEQLRSAVAAAVVHDFRSPLHAILLQLELLATRIGEDASAQSVVDSIRWDVTRLVRLTTDMLDATRVAIEDVPLMREVVDLGAIVARIADGMRPRLAPHPVELRVRPVPPVSVDPARIEQIVQNLLDNAAKYSPEHAPIGIDIEPHAGGACIRVTDRGSGIAPNDLPRLFDRFFQTHTARELGKGFGLGLFIAKGLVLAHGGRIDVESELGRGSEFRVWFPGTAGEDSADETMDETLD
jgi:PAS domain S-box-containing protein